MSSPDERRPLIARDTNQSYDTGQFRTFLNELQANGARDTPGSSKSGTSTPRYQNAKRKLSQATKKSYWSYYVPIFSWLPTYSPRLFMGDLVAGLTLTCLLVPQGMSYAANLARLDPVNGLFGVIVPAFLYALLGTSRQLSVGPEASLSLIVGQTVDKLLAAHGHLPDEAKADIRQGIASAIVFEAGLITFLLGLFRLGFLDAVLSKALLRGFITAVGAVIFVEQLSQSSSLRDVHYAAEYFLVPLLGLGPQAAKHGVLAQQPIDKLIFVVQHLRSTHTLTAAISAAAIFVLIAAKILKPKLAPRIGWINYLPEILIVVIISTYCCDRFRWDGQGVAVLGRVSAGAVHVHFPIHSSSLWKYAVNQEVLGSAATIAIIGYVDSIVAAKQNGARFNYAVSPNRELTALGIANLGASLVSGTIPGYGSITRSRLAANAGARSPLASFFVALFSLLTTFLLLKFLFYLPKAVLGAIVIVVVYSILAETPEDIAYFWRMRAWTDLALMTLTFCLTVLVSVQIGIVVSVACSLILVVRQASRSMGMQIMGRTEGTDQWEPIEENPDEDDLPVREEVPGVLIVRMRETLHFANAGALKERLRRLERYGLKKAHPSEAPIREEAQVIILHFKDLLSADPSSVQILMETCESYLRRNVEMYFVHVVGDIRKTFEKAGLLDLIGRENIYASVKDCLAAVQASGTTLRPPLDV